MNIVEGFFEFKGQKRDRDGNFTWLKPHHVFENKEFRSRCFFTALDRYVEEFKVDMTEDEPLLRDVVVRS